MATFFKLILLIFGLLYLYFSKIAPEVHKHSINRNCYNTNGFHGFQTYETLSHGRSTFGGSYLYIFATADGRCNKIVLNWIGCGRHQVIVVVVVVVFVTIIFLCVVFGVPMKCMPTGPNLRKKLKKTNATNVH